MQDKEIGYVLWNSRCPSSPDLGVEVVHGRASRGGMSGVATMLFLRPRPLRQHRPLVITSPFKVVQPKAANLTI